MVAMKDSWIYNAIFDNRKGLVNSSAELETYKSEFDRYFLWVITFEVWFKTEKLSQLKFRLDVTIIVRQLLKLGNISANSKESLQQTTDIWK